MPAILADVRAPLAELNSSLVAQPLASSPYVSPLKKKVAKRRKSVGVPGLPQSDNDCENALRARVDYLEFELENSQEDNETLQQDLATVRSALSSSEEQCAALRAECDALKAQLCTPLSPATSNAHSELGLSAKVCGGGLLGVAAAANCGTGPSFAIVDVPMTAPKGDLAPPEASEASLMASEAEPTAMAQGQGEAFCSSPAMMMASPSQAGVEAPQPPAGSPPSPAAHVPSALPLAEAIEVPVIEGCSSPDHERSATSPPPPPPPPAADVPSPPVSEGKPPADAHDAHAETEPPPPPAAPPDSDVSALATRRRSRRKSVVSKELVRGGNGCGMESDSDADDSTPLKAPLSAGRSSATRSSAGRSGAAAEATPGAADAAGELFAGHAMRGVFEGAELASPPPEGLSRMLSAEEGAVEASSASSDRVAAGSREGTTSAQVAPMLREAPSDVAPAAMPSEEMLRTVGEDQRSLLRAVFDATVAMAEPPSSMEPAALSAISRLLDHLGDVVTAQRGRQTSTGTTGKKATKKGTKGPKADKPPSAKSVRFAAHDLSCTAPPKVQTPGSEKQQAALIAELRTLMALQDAVLPFRAAPRHPLTAPRLADDATLADDAALAATQPTEPGTAAAPADTNAGASPAEDAVACARACLSSMVATLSALKSASALSGEMKAAASFYAHEMHMWVALGVPIFSRRLGELLSSSLRFHLSAIFSEEEDTPDPDPTLLAIKARVKEHAAAFGISIGGEESFSSVVSSALLSLHQTAPVMSDGSAARAALTAAAPVLAAAENASSPGAISRSAEVAELHELAAEDKERVLQYAQAHSVLLAIFGPREPLAKLMRTPGNTEHFARLEALAEVVDALHAHCELDESYFVPLRSVEGLQRRLHVEAGMCKAAHEGLLVFAMNSKRRSSRRARA